MLRPIVLMSDGTDPLDLAAGGDHENFVGVNDGENIDDFAVAGGGLDVSKPFAASTLAAVLAAAA